ncbi:hypothetical protein [Tumidithrix helvetica]
MSDESVNSDKNFDAKRLLFSLGIGGVAGGLGALGQRLDKEMLLTL